MKLKNYLIASLLLNFSLYAGNEHSNTTADPKVNIEIVNIVTNGLILPNNIISFTNVEDLEIEFDVKISYAGNNTKITEKGVVNCYYYEPNSFDNEIAQYYNNGVYPRYLFQNEDITLEPTKSGYSYTFRQKLRFKKNIIFNNGCSFVFRYRTATLPTDISNKLTYKIIGGTRTGKEPYKPSTANINLTKICYSDGSPLINNKIIIPDYEGNEIGSRSINLSFNYECIYGSELPKGYYAGCIIQIARDKLGSTSLTKWITPIISNGTLTFNNLKIKSSDISPNTKLRIWFNFQEVAIDLNCAIVKTSRPILYNTISDNQSIPIGGTSKPIIGAVAKMSLDPTGTWNTVEITKYQWQQKTTNNNWANIIGATFQNYTPTNTFNETTSFRRIAISNEGLLDYSEYITISTTASPENNICCNQNLPYSTSQPSTFTGNIIDNSNSYQWQISQKPWGWINIPNANSQNFNYIFTYEAGRGNESASFRRLIIQNEAIISASNSITVIRSTSPEKIISSGNPIRVPNKGRRTSIFSKPSITKSDQNNIEDIIIYPNPFTNNFSIEGSVNINSINLYDSFGQAVNIEKYQKTNNLIEVNTSKLQSGIFLLKVNNTTFSKTLMKN